MSEFTSRWWKEYLRTNNIQEGTSEFEFQSRREQSELLQKMQRLGALTTQKNTEVFEARMRAETALVEEMKKGPPTPEYMRGVDFSAFMIDEVREEIGEITFRRDIMSSAPSAGLQQQGLFSVPQWAVIQLLGHQTYIGKCHVSGIGFNTMLVVAVPAVGNDRAYEVYVAPNALFKCVPVTEALARQLLAENAPQALPEFDLPPKPERRRAFDGSEY